MRLMGKFADGTKPLREPILTIDKKSSGTHFILNGFAARTSGELNGNRYFYNINLLSRVNLSFSFCRLKFHMIN